MMHHEPGIPGTIGEEARRLRWQRLAQDLPPGGPGGSPCRVYEATTPDGTLRAIVSQDPAGKDGAMLWHISVSHRDKDGVPDRLPSWDEIKHAFYRLVQADVPMVLIFPSRSAAASGKFVNVHDTCLHLWEAERGIDQ